MKRLILLAILGTLCLTGQSVTATAQIELTGAGSTVQVTTTSTPARIVQFQAGATNTGTARCGNSSVTSSSGFRLPAGSGQFLPALPQGPNGLNRFYDLSVYYCNIVSGDKVTVTGWN